MSIEVTSADIGKIRRFNRFYTRTIGVLNETLSKSAFTLTEARVLFELGAGLESASLIAERLLVDPAYLARVLDKFTRTGLLTTTVSGTDRRARILTLTAPGRAILAGLEEAAGSDILRILDGKAADVPRLLTAMDDIASILGGEPVEATPIVLRSFETGDVGWVIGRQSRLYAEEYGWTNEYEAMVCEIGGRFIRDFQPGRDFCWIAQRGGVRLGAVFLIGRDDGDAQLRMLHVERSARGRGVGTLLVDRCIETAREVGYPRLTLWTNDILAAARRIYERAGFTLVEEERHHSFGKDLVGQTWHLAL